MDVFLILLYPYMWIVDCGLWIAPQSLWIVDCGWLGECLDILSTIRSVAYFPTILSAVFDTKIYLLKISCKHCPFQLKLFLGIRGDMIQDKELSRKYFSKS